jgi:hypothetical protein
MRRYVIRGLVLGAVASLVALAAAGAGHGTYLPAKLLFPFAMLCAVFGSSITAPYIVIALVQFPLYGVLLDAASRRSRFTLCAVILACAHLTLAAIDVFAPADSSFSTEPRPPSNLSLQPTAGRSGVSLTSVKTRPFQSTLAPASGG